MRGFIGDGFGKGVMYKLHLTLNPKSFKYGGCMDSVLKRNRVGVKNSKNIADVIYE